MSLSREQEIVEYLKKTYNSKAIIKYGSFADGSANENSDFDTLVITTDADAIVLAYNSSPMKEIPNESGAGSAYAPHR